jgi:hypothetical protein
VIYKSSTLVLNFVIYNSSTLVLNLGMASYEKVCYNVSTTIYTYNGPGFAVVSWVIANIVALWV